MSLNPDSVTTVAAEIQKIPRLVVVLENPDDPRVKTINFFLHGLHTMENIAREAGSNLENNDSCTDPKWVEMLNKLNTAMGHLCTIIRLQSPDTKADAAPGIESTKAYMTALVAEDELVQDEQSQVDLYTEDGINKAADILLGYLSKEFIQKEQKSVSAGAAQIVMSRTDVVALTTVFSMMSHDLRIPMASIQAYSQMYHRKKERLNMHRDGDAADFQERLDELAKTSGGLWVKLAAQIQRTLELIQDPYPQEELSTQEWVAFVKDAAKSWKEKGVEVSIAEVGEKPISWSRSWCASFVDNCIQNAFRAGSTRAEVIVGENDKCFYVEIKDYGDGFDDKMLKSGFDGSHGYSRKRRRSNKESKGIAMRVLSKMARAYGGGVSFGNWYDHEDDNKKHGLVRLELPFAEETLEELAEEVN